ncbi:scarecrow-like protein 30 [Humulus lupulus]|uniref:scarecrow-like protein 30 n=1 Tax=Humulus lupulus TaxID=3486 RepID=UPI002B403B26|nr:scarecrow-like protein 30 [Humulus lupulus]
MDTLLDDFAVSMNGFNYNPKSFSFYSNQSYVRDAIKHGGVLQPCDYSNGLHQHHSCESSQNSSTCSEVDSPGYSDSFTATLKFISEMLMEEEDLERKSLTLQDPLALQAAEKSFYDVLGQNYPPSSDKGEYVSSKPFPSSVKTSFDTRLVQGPIFGGVQSVARFRGNTTGKPTSSFSQKGKTQMIDLDKDGVRLQRGKTNHQSGYDDVNSEEVRSSKHVAVKGDDFEPTEMLDRVLLYHGENEDELAQKLQQQQHGKQGKRSGKMKRSKKQDKDKGDMVDLWTLLTQCAQAVASYDQRTATDLFKQIRQHSSPDGDATQRLAHYFANGLEARLAGTRAVSYSPLVSNEMSVVDILRGHQLYITACPFLRMSYCFANRTIMNLAKNAKTIHIIDFGIQYGFQWPGLIQRLSQTPGGPPKLRMTGIELPQPGFRPTERVEETKRRLENYCKRFNVPSEYNMIAKKWETICYEDLKINKDELVVVNCLHRLKHILDETVVINNPRDTVLKLIRRINPDIFIHGVSNGTYNAPFFLTRFREALLHFSSLFDMFDSTVPREERFRMEFEKAIYGRDIKNIVACEGTERVERPESYKQWQVRNVRAGFKQTPLDQEIFEAVKKKVQLSYHKDFIVEQLGEWLLQGWKGRRIFAISCWKPV